MTFRTGLELTDTQAKAAFEVFVNFIGGQELLRQLMRLTRKFRRGSPTRELFADRYAIQIGIVRLAKRFKYFATADLNDPLQLRALSFIAGVNAATKSMLPDERDRFKAVITAEFAPDRDIRSVEHEIRCFIHLAQRGCEVIFADLRGERYDFLVRIGSEEFEVECKTLSEHTGLGFTPEGIARIVEEIFSLETFIHKFGFDNDLMLEIDYDHLSSQSIEAIVKNVISTRSDSPHIRIRTVIDTELSEKLDMIEHGASLNADDNSVITFRRTSFGRIIVKLVVLKKPIVVKRALETLKQAADQLSGARPGVCWLHFLGISDREFTELINHMDREPNSGLNALASGAIHSNDDFEKRSHVSVVRFSASTNTLTRRPTLGADRLLVRTVSLDGPMYDARNPKAKFELNAAF